MKKIGKILTGLFLTTFLSVSIFAQQSSVTRNNLNKVEIDSIIQKTARNEDEFRQALTTYVFKRKVKIQTVGLGGLITGSYIRDSLMTFKKSGERFERITFHPVSTLDGFAVTPNDLEDLGGVNPFAINPRDLNLYNISYVGKEKIDELNLHVFDVRPKVIPKFKKAKKRYFLGRIWIDDHDLMIVRSKGKGVPEGKNDKYPVVDTWRTNVDGKFWFPAYSSSDDELVFASGNVVKMRLRVRFEDYRVGTSEVTILDDVDDPEENNKKDQ